MLESQSPDDSPEEATGEHRDIENRNVDEQPKEPPQPHSETPPPSSETPDEHAPLGTDRSGELRDSENHSLADAADADTIAADHRSAMQIGTPSSSAQLGRLPEPGLLEAVLWTIGVLMVHLVGAITIMILMVVLLMATGAYQHVNQAIEVVQQDFAIELMGSEQLVFVLVVLVAVGLRFGSKTRKYLSPIPVWKGHLLLILSLVLPLSMVSGEIYRVTSGVWENLLDRADMLEKLPDFNTVEALQIFASTTPVYLLILIIAVAPAIGEELVFRGVVGRGLVARYGCVVGVLITSVLFAIVHLHPAHVIGVIPLGIVMHFLYLATRSFWAPVLYHLLNNSWAVVASKYGEDEGVEVLAVHVGLPLSIWLSSLGYVVVACWLIWQTRVVYQSVEGHEWNPGYTTVEQPPDTFNLQRVRRPAHLGVVGLTLLAFVIFLATAAAFLITHQ